MGESNVHFREYHPWEGFGQLNTEKKICIYKSRKVMVGDYVEIISDVKERGLGETRFGKTRRWKQDEGTEPSLCLL